MRRALWVIVGANVAHLLSSAALTAGGGDAEMIHRLRVGIRRLRSALILFEKHLEPQANERLSSALQAYGRIFGATRDLDVFLHETIPRAQRDGVEGTWLRSFTSAAECARARSYRAVAESIGNAEFSGLLLSIGKWVEDEAWSGELLVASTGDEPLEKYAPAMLGALAKRVRKRGKDIASRPLTELHALRKAIRKLRYNVDCLSALYDRQSVEKYADACEDLQDLLGAINDTVTTEYLAIDLAKGRRGFASASNALERWNSVRREKLCLRIPEVWDGFRKRDPFWK